jgi:hypothetical protein
MEPFARFAEALLVQQARFVVIGVAGANFYARSGGTIFTTHDQDLFLPPDPENLSRAWEACSGLGMSLWAGDEPLDMPRDVRLARAVVQRSAGTTATSDELQVDLSLVMAGFDFDEVWTRRRNFVVDGVEIPVARLSDIVRSKAMAGREKDRLFLATHRDALRQLMGKSYPAGD